MVYMLLLSCLPCKNLRYSYKTLLPFLLSSVSLMLPLNFPFDVFLLLCWFRLLFYHWYPDWYPDLNFSFLLPFLSLSDGFFLLFWTSRMIVSSALSSFFDLYLKLAWLVSGSSWILPPFFGTNIPAAFSTTSTANVGSYWRWCSSTLTPFDSTLPL